MGILTAALPNLTILGSGETDERNGQTVDSVPHSKQSAERRFALGVIVAVFLSGCCLSGSALADRGDRRGGGFDRFTFPGAARDNPQREANRDDQRRQRRMSEEQREQLRRDIDEAGRDIYRRPRRGRGQ